MDGSSSPEGRAEVGLATSHGRVARLFHWAVVAMVAVQIPVGIAMTSEPLTDLADPLYVLHKGLGALLLATVLARIFWRIMHRPPPLPDFLPPREKRIAHATHLALYGLLLLMGISGYVRTVADGYPIELLDWMGIPPVVPFLPGMASAMLVIHQFAVFALVALAAIHVSAVLRHQLIDGNPLLQRMWPPTRSD